MSGMTKPAPALSGIMTSIRGSVSTELAVELPNDVVHEGKTALYNLRNHY